MAFGVILFYNHSGTGNVGTVGATEWRVSGEMIDLELGSLDETGREAVGPGSIFDSM